MDASSEGPEALMKPSGDWGRLLHSTREEEISVKKGLRGWGSFSHNPLQNTINLCQEKQISNCINWRWTSTQNSDISVAELQHHYKCACSHAKSEDEMYCKCDMHSWKRNMSRSCFTWTQFHWRDWNIIMRVVRVIEYFGYSFIKKKVHFRSTLRHAHFHGTGFNKRVSVRVSVFKAEIKWNINISWNTWTEQKLGNKMKNV